MAFNSKPDGATALKQCCAELYSGELARLLLGPSFHPGGERLTGHLGTLLHLTPESRVLDVASGNGASAFLLAQRFGCHVVGIDYSGANVARANEQAATKGLSSKVAFVQADAEGLPLPDVSFDAVVCECAFCTFPHKTAAAREFARVLNPAGCLGLSDLTRSESLPEELNTMLAWIACIADAQPVAQYVECLRSAGLVPGRIERHDQVLVEMVRQIRLKLLTAEALIGLEKLSLPGVDLKSAKEVAQRALTAILDGQLGYVLLVAEKAGKSP